MADPVTVCYSQGPTDGTGDTLVSPTTPLPVTLVTGGTDQDVNIVSVGGNAVTTSLPVSGLAATNVDNVTPVATGAIMSQSNLMAYDRTTGNWDRVPNVQSQASGVINPNTGMLAMQVFGRSSDTESRSLGISTFGSVDTTAAATNAALVATFGLTYDQVLNQFARTRYPSISTTNSSTATLGIGAIFTGTSVGTQGYGSITVTAISNVTSATNGLSIQQSSDGTNWDITDTYTVPAGTPAKINVPRQGVFFRVVYTNGGTGQASFRLQTILNTEMPTSSSMKPVDAMSLENDFAATLSVPALSNGQTLDVGRAINGAQAAGTGTQAMALAPHSASAGAIVPSVSSVAASNVAAKGSAGNLYGLNVTSGASAGYVMVFNATSLPSNGTVTPIKTYVIAANSTIELEFSPPIRLGTGITVGFSTTGPFTLTASATAFISVDYV